MALQLSAYGIDRRDIVVPYNAIQIVIHLIMKKKVTIRLSSELISAMKLSGVTNVSGYISDLVERDLGLSEGKAVTLADLLARVKVLEAKAGVDRCDKMPA